MPTASAPARERSMTRPGLNGPRSLMRTTTERPLSSLTTRTKVLNGKVLCAAVSWLGSKIAPLAVRGPAKPGPYHDAMPRSPSTLGRAAAAALERGHAALPLVVAGAKAASAIAVEVSTGPEADGADGACPISAAGAQADNATTATRTARPTGRVRALGALDPGSERSGFGTGSSRRTNARACMRSCYARAS